MIGFTGSHRTGKTTMKDLILERNSSERLRSFDFSVSEQITHLGEASSDLSLPWDRRKLIQEHLLNAMTFSLSMFGRFPQRSLLYSLAVGVADRTPIDLVGYLLLTVPTDLNVEEVRWVNTYIEKCIALTNKYFDVLYYFPADIEFINDPKSGSQDTQKAVDEIISGTLIHPSLTVPVVRIKYPEIEDRYATIIGYYNDHIRSRR